MKLATVTATFPELSGTHCHKTGRGKGSSPKVAIARAFSDVLRQVSRRRFTLINCTVVVINAQPEA